MKLFHLTCASTNAAFGLSLFARDLKQALAKARRMLEGTGYAPHPRKD
ncbi:hypothetical protein M2323_004699 [Rhodoblastus acidophilus]|nr:hypothetical protein [Rhodoblastus acidophilus]MCW2335743.1 hypothetical protein [Rhodoblastus acidophilus]